MEFKGTYGGVVENTRDPEKIGRVKVRVPHLHGISSSTSGYIASNDLPWAMPAGLPAGGSGASGGFSHLPAVGDHVWVRFLDGEPEKPVWEWGMQTFSDRNNLKLHSYAANPDGTVGLPDAARWTYSGHLVEISASGVSLLSQGSYRVRIVDGTGDGRVEVQTALGNSLTLDDTDNGITAFVNEDMVFNIGETMRGTSNAFDWITTTEDFTATSGNDMTLTAAVDMALQALTVTVESLEQTDLISPRVNLGNSSAVEPVLLGQLTVQFLNQVLLYLTTHTHGNGNNGSPTTPPILPPQTTVTTPTESLKSQTVFTT